MANLPKSGFAQHSRNFARFGRSNSARPCHRDATVHPTVDIFRDGGMSLFEGLSEISCLRHNMHSRSVYASQDEDPAGGVARDPGRTT